MPLTPKDLPRNLRSTRRLSACNLQITAEMQQKLLKASTKTEANSNDSMQVFKIFSLPIQKK